MATDWDEARTALEDIELGDHQSRLTREAIIDGALTSGEQAERRVAELEAEARRFYRADGSFEDLDPAEVVERRKAAAAELASLRAQVETLTAWRGGAETILARDLKLLREEGYNAQTLGSIEKLLAGEVLGKLPEIEHLRAQLGRAQSQRNVDQHSIKHLGKQLTQSTEEVARLAAQVETLTRQRNEADSEAGKLLVRAEATESRVETLTRDLTAWRDAAATLQAQVSTATERAEQLQLERYEALSAGDAWCRQAKASDERAEKAERERDEAYRHDEAVCASADYSTKRALAAESQVKALREALGRARAVAPFVDGPDHPEADRGLSEAMERLDPRNAGRWWHGPDAREIIARAAFESGWDSALLACRAALASEAAPADWSPATGGELVSGAMAAGALGTAIPEPAPEAAGTGETKP